MIFVNEGVGKSMEHEERKVKALEEIASRLWWIAMWLFILTTK